MTAGDKDFYENLSKGDLERRFILDILFAGHEFFYNIYSQDLYFWGFKAGQPDDRKPIPKNFIDDVNNIKRQPTPSRSKHAKTAIKFWIHLVFAKVVGERIYHDMVIAWETVTKIENSSRGSA